MKIWFGATSAQFLEYKAYYYSIRNYLVNSGCVILFDWLEDAEKELVEHKGKRDIKKIYEGVIKAIDEADAVIIEYTIPNFSSSHQINYSLFRKKPTLVIRQHKDNEEYSGSYIEMIESPFLTIKNYSKENYKDILKEFIGLSRIEQGQQRYNIVLGRREKYYLDWASAKYKKSRSEIIRNLINKNMEEDDSYKRYL